MNHPFVIEAAKRLLQRSEIAGEAEVSRRVCRIYRLVYGREAHADEEAWARQFLQAEQNTLVAWERYVQALLLANEFVFLD